jgi:hypothetical protein
MPSTSYPPRLRTSAQSRSSASRDETITLGGGVNCDRACSRSSQHPSGSWTFVITTPQGCSRRCAWQFAHLGKELKRLANSWRICCAATNSQNSKGETKLTSAPAAGMSSGQRIQHHRPFSSDMIASGASLTCFSSRVNLFSP